MSKAKLIAVVLFLAMAGAIIFWVLPKPQPPVKLQMRTFKVDRAAFYQGLNLSLDSNVSDSDIARAAKDFFKKAGVDLSARGRSIAYNGKLDLLFVKASAKELDVVERAIDAWNRVAPQIHIKARFMKVPQSAFDAIWKTGTVVDKTETNMVEIISAKQFKPLVRELENDGSETLAEPEVVTTSGRQTQMRAVGTSSSPLLASTSKSSVGVLLTEKSETGPTVDMVPYVLADGVTIYLQTDINTIQSQTPTRFAAQAHLWDGQTLAKASLAPEPEGNKRLIVFITATGG
jgi:hypothetical protein